MGATRRLRIPATAAIDPNADDDAEDPDEIDLDDLPAPTTATTATTTEI